VKRCGGGWELGRHGDARYSSASSIGKLPFRMKQRFLYLFDFGDQYEFDVQLIETSPEPPREHYPRVVEQHGKMPPQYPNGDDEPERFVIGSSRHRAICMVARRAT